MTAPPAPRRSLSSIRYTLPFLLVAPIIMTVVLSVAFAIYNGRRAVRDFGTTVSIKTLGSIEQHVEAYLDKPSLLNRAHAATANSVLLNLEDTESLVSYFWQQSKLSEDADLDSLSFGSTTGEFVLVQQFPDDTGELRIRTTETAPNREFYRLNSVGLRTGRTRVQEYDPRTRPWYQAGVEAGRPVWSSIFQAADASTLNISSIVPIYNDGRVLQGVLAATIRLEALNDFLTGLDISPNGEAFIVETSGELVASSTREPVVVEQENGDRQRLLAVESSDPLLARTAQELLTRFERLDALEEFESFSFRLDGGRQVVSIVPLNPDLGLDWLVVAIVPDQDFSKIINDTMQATLTIGSVLAFLAVVLGFYAARWLVRPIEHLGRAARDIKSDRFQPYTLQEVVARRDELGDLGRAFQDMGIVISDRQQSFTAQVQELRQQTTAADSASMRGIEIAYYRALQDKAKWLRSQQAMDTAPLANPDSQTNDNRAK
ncbi:MAG: HAMP domain-containing protein [Spirulinaceae cyanobacterium RM2_2_10]|nr:HAMP domain-containing protein [Spirulinaceae cyanobacterium SM2_1_0]NJO21044.1 HAMP domain-containing protein [Spirulinaceae cyanobacterium RM2_2_10]